MLTLFTNSSAMSSTNSMNRANAALSTAMERLGTGKRINSAADDAAGLQIATRLEGQSRGMSVAKDNITKATAMLQTAEGAFDEVSNIMFRMKDLATQAADATSTSPEDQKAMQAEFDALNSELGNIMGNTAYGSEKLLAASGGKLGAAMNFQIGATAGESLQVDLSGQLTATASAITTLASGTLASGASGMITSVTDALNAVGEIRSALGANINRLGHTAANLANMKDNTDLGLGNIRDADFAKEGSQMSRQQMLMQSSQMMLKQSNGMGQMVLGMLG
ncbi:lateral flagellin LafA [Pantoea sp. Mb-10]|uniref:flagellin N-terminal helical domain-containing protein n=1 Tax=unclassified Pantoea TaxID=2630326 RepID=UPI001E5480E1|nr:MULTISPECIES: flagellin [unclassified Pantoea]MCE0489857.1 lateral flagellin LafA [Pantoea sp. Mb-10]MCE0501037.1 lateral flagellin LafA [Pantoea sp. Pb-8]